MTAVYCYVTRSGARGAEFPEVVDPSRAVEETRRLRTRLRNVIAALGLNPTLHGHLFSLEVWTVEPHLHICSVEATP